MSTAVGRAPSATNNFAGTAFRESAAGEAGTTGSYVLPHTFATRINDVAVDGIDPGIMFDVDPRNPPRPRIPKLNEYVVVTWQQSQSFGYAPLLLIVDTETLKARESYYSGINDGQYVQEFSVPRREVTRPCLLVFILPDRRPGIVSLPSLAKAAYDLAANGEEGDESTNDVHHLLLLDPCLKASARCAARVVSRPGKLKEFASNDVVTVPLPASTPTPTPTETATGQNPPPAVATVAPSETPSSSAEPFGNYDGTIADQAAGAGRFSVDLREDAANDTWAASFGNALQNNGGLVSVIERDQNTLVFLMRAKDSAGCSYRANATISAETMNGTYIGLGACATNGGTFRLTRSSA